MNGAVLMSQRQTAVTLPALEMACDEKEIPEPANSSTPVGWWLAERSSFRGAAALADHPDEYRSTTCEGTTALAVTAERVIGIVCPNDGTTPAVWWSWGLPSLDIQTAGSQGFLKKRPTMITLAHDSASIELSGVSRLYRNSGRYQTGQEGSLLNVLS